MNLYTCNSSFISQFHGKHYVYGSEIYETEYEKLTKDEQRNFSKVPGIPPDEALKDIDIRGRDVVEDLMENFDNSDLDIQEDHEFGDFGGGDGGGAGASDDF